MNQTIEKPGFLKNAEDKITEKSDRMRQEQKATWFSKFETPQRLKDAAAKLAEFGVKGKEKITTVLDFFKRKPQKVKIEPTLNAANTATVEEKPGFLKTAEDKITEKSDRVREEQEAEGSKSLDEKPGFLKTAEKNPESRMEFFKKRSLEAGKSLAKYGLNISDSYNKLTPKQKVAAGFIFAGAALATGGLSSVVTKAITTGGTAKLFYDAQIQKIKAEKGENISEADIKKAAIKAIAAGLVLGFGVPAVLQNSNFVSIFQSIGIGDTAKNIAGFTKEVVGDVSKSVTDGTRTAYQWLKSSMPNLSMDAEATTTTTTHNTIPTAVTTPEAPVTPTLPDDIYTIQKGDALETVLLENIKFPDGMTQGGKLNSIYNMLDTDAAKVILKESGITDINNIQPGQGIDIAKLVQTIENTKIKGESLLSRASRIN